MAQEMGESRDAIGLDVMQMAEDFANNTKSETRPFWIVYACKEDKGMSNKLGRPAFKQAMKAYYQKPPVIFGILTWYVNHPKGIFRFVPELSAPPDVPLDPRLISDKKEDFSERVATQGEKMNAIIS
jgi:hypothetical protein